MEKKKHYNTKMSSHDHLSFNKYPFKTPASVVQMPQIQYIEFIVQFINPHNEQHSLAVYKKPDWSMDHWSMDHPISE